VTVHDEAGGEAAPAGLPGLTDLHSHLVPAVDDGAPTLEHALEGVSRMAAQGITRIVTTPHLEGSRTHDAAGLAADLDAVARAFEPVREAVAQHHPDLAIGQAYEVRLDVPDPDLSDPRLRLPGTNVVLVEWAALLVPPSSAQAIERIGEQGVRPLLAHPERYRGLDARIELVDEWRTRGAWMMVNHGSLVGRYGNEARRLAHRLLARGWVDALATDFHGRPQLPLYLEEARAWFEGKDATEAWRLLAVENPARIARGASPLEVSPLPQETGLAARIFRALGGAGG
jgi:protein-tyrosine phosphatase